MRGEEIRAERVIYAVDVLDVGTRDDENVCRIDWLPETVEEGDDRGRPLDHVGGSRTPDDLAEDAGVAGGHDPGVCASVSAR